MFFADRRAAIQEMLRVLVPGRCLAVAVWDSLDSSPGYDALVRLLEHMFGPDAAEALRAPFALGDRHTLASLFAGAGVPSAVIKTHAGVVRFPSIEAWIHTDVKGWTPLGDRLDDAQFARLVAESERDLAPFVTTAGTVEFPIHAHIITTRKV
jgi:hypothetical protein